MKTLPFYVLMAALSICSLGKAMACDPIAVDDQFELQLTSDVIVVNVLLNDDLKGVDSFTVRLLSQPAIGTATVDEKTNQIIYKSSENKGGQIGFEYEVCTYSIQCGESCSSASLDLEVLELPVVPEGLTLNGDGFNEGLRLTNVRGYNKLEITIVNRWGHLIYRNNNYDNFDPWRGTYGGTDKLVEPGVYYYYLIPSLNGKEFETQTSTLYIFN